MFFFIPKIKFHNTTRNNNYSYYYTMKVHREIQIIINYNFYMIKCNYDNLCWARHR